MSSNTQEVLFQGKLSSLSTTLLTRLYRYFHEVLGAMLTLHRAVVRQPIEGEPIPARIAHDAKYLPYFKDCVGALDGTHVEVYVCKESPIPWRNRKGTLSQNVLVVCDFELMFRYVLPGWEGSAHDMRVLRDAVTEGGLRAPQGRFYLGDAGYTSSDMILTPFRGVKYHLREQWQSEKREISLFPLYLQLTDDLQA
jgi:hypothetical protein